MPGAIDGVAASQNQSLHGSVDDAMQSLGGMDSEGFLNLLVAQLRYQDPMEPADSNELMAQTSALAQLDATQQLLQINQRALGMQQSVSAVGMIGHEVTATGPDGQNLTGVVDGVRYTAGGPVLEIGGNEVALGSVTGVSDASAVGALDPTPEAAPLDPDLDTDPDADPEGDDPVADGDGVIQAGALPDTLNGYAAGVGPNA